MNLKRGLLSLFLMVVICLGCGIKVQAKDEILENSEDGLTVRVSKVEQNSDSLKINLVYVNHSGKQLDISAPNTSVYSGKDVSYYDSQFNYRINHDTYLANNDSKIKDGETKEQTLYFEPVNSNKIDIFLVREHIQYKFLKVDVNKVSGASISEFPVDLEKFNKTELKKVSAVNNFTNLTFNEFFLKLNNKREESLIKNIIISSKISPVEVFKHNDKDTYSLFIDTHEKEKESAYGEGGISIIYDFSKGKPSRRFVVTNYHQFLSKLDENEKKQFVNYIKEFIDEPDMAPKFEECNRRIHDYVMNNVNSLAQDLANDENRIRVDEHMIVNNPRCRMSYTLSSFGEELNYSVNMVTEY